MNILSRRNAGDRSGHWAAWGGTDAVGRGEGIHAITRLGHSVLLAESNIHHVPEYTDRLYVIERGEIVFAGKPVEVYNHEQVLKVIGGTP